MSQKNQTVLNCIFKTNREGGFSLIETLVAVMILSTAMLLLTNSWSAAFNRVRKTQVQFEVSALLERKMFEVEMEYYNKPIDSIPEEQSGDFSDKYPQYKWRLKSKKLEVPDLSPLMTSQEGGANQMLITVIKQMTEALGKAIREVQVTIIMDPSNAKQKPQEYSATRYFVDYDKSVL
jgi:general secretion pathway protein I